MFLSYGYYCCDEIPKACLEGKRFFFSYNLPPLFIIKGSQGRNLSRSSMWNRNLTERNVVYWLAHPIFYSPQGHKPTPWHHQWWVGCSSIYHKLRKYPTYSTFCWKHFLKTDFLLTDHFSLCQTVISYAPVHIYIDCTENMEFIP